MYAEEGILLYSEWYLASTAFKNYLSTYIRIHMYICTYSLINSCFLSSVGGQVYYCYSTSESSPQRMLYVQGLKNFQFLCLYNVSCFHVVMLNFKFHYIGMSLFFLVISKVYFYKIGKAGRCVKTWMIKKWPKKLKEAVQSRI